MGRTIHLYLQVSGVATDIEKISLSQTPNAVNGKNQDTYLKSEFNTAGATASWTNWNNDITFTATAKNGVAYWTISGDGRGTLNSSEYNMSVNYSNNEYVYTLKISKTVDNKTINIRPVVGHSYFGSYKYNDSNKIEKILGPQDNTSFSDTISREPLNPHTQGDDKYARGWSKTKNSTTITYSLNSSFDFTSDYETQEDAENNPFILYPAYQQWKKLKIKYNINDGSGTIEEIIYKRLTSSGTLTKEEKELSRDFVPDREGYAFYGWHNTKQGPTDPINTKYPLVPGINSDWGNFTFSTSTNTITVYGVWRGVYLASFRYDANGGQWLYGATDNYYQILDSSNTAKKEISLFSDDNIQRSGHKLIGWYCTTNGKTYDLGEKTEDFTFVSTLESDTTPIYDFKAVWQSGYTLLASYSAGHGRWGDGRTGDYEEIFKETQPFDYIYWTDVPIPNDENYIFSHWLDDDTKKSYQKGETREISYPTGTTSLSFSVTAQYKKKDQDGLIYINKQPYVPYIYTKANGWQPFQAYVFSDGAWKITTITTNE